MILDNIHRLFATHRDSKKSRARRAVTPVLEPLDERLVPAVLQVGVHQQFHTITSALQAASPGDTVLVHPGIYQEAVDINKNGITLRGVNKSAIIQAPASLVSNDYALVWVDGVTGVTIRNLTVEGPYNGTPTDVNGLLLGMHAGIFVSDGGSATIANNLVTDIRDNPPNNVVDDGFGILVGSNNQVLNTTGTAVIEGNTVVNYGQAGIDVAKAGCSATISNNVVTGLSPALANQYLSQIGIDIQPGGSATIQGNTVTQNALISQNSAGIYVNTAGSASVSNNTVSGNTTGILVFSTPDVSITGNTVSANVNDGIVLNASSGAVLLVNQFTQNGGNGISLFDSTNDQIALNRSLNNVNDGIFVDGASTGTFFVANVALGNGNLDAEDLSTGTGTAGTGNKWIFDFGSTDNKSGRLVSTAF
jgi:parallel beta-helix repeat protein